MNTHIDRLKRLLIKLRIYRPIGWIYRRIWLRERREPVHLSTLLNLLLRRFGFMTKKYPPFRGYFEHLDYSQGVLSISGWMFVPGLVLDEFHIELNRVHIGTIKPQERKDVEKRLPFRGARLSGFHVEARLSESEPTMSNWVDVDIFGLVKAKEAARLSTMYRPDYRDSWAEPPARLMQRTIASEKTSFYWLLGLQSFSEYYKSIERHYDVKKAKRLLDWGCGCGRMSRFFLKHLEYLEVHGCDIDREQIEWCASNLPKGQFAVIAPFPPTRYADDMFDLVISWSVFTHLQREHQLDWLREMRRIIAPGGLLLASVSGESLMKFASPEAQREMLKNGISDRRLDRALDGIAPAGYYRGTLQRKSYTCREFSQYFRIVDYLEQGATSSQDLVVMRKE